MSEYFEVLQYSLHHNIVLFTLIGLLFFVCQYIHVHYNLHNNMVLFITFMLSD